MSTPIYAGTLDWKFSSAEQNKHFAVFVMILFGGVVFWFFLFLWLNKVKANYFEPKDSRPRLDSWTNATQLAIPEDKDS